MDVNTRDSVKRTFLHEAIDRGYSFIAQALISFTVIDVNAKDIWGLTPLHVAAAKGNIVVVKALLTRPELRLERNNQGQTPLDITSARFPEVQAELKRRAF